MALTPLGTTLANGEGSIGNIKSVEVSIGKRGSLDVSSLGASNKTFLAGLHEPGEVTVEISSGITSLASTFKKGSTSVGEVKSVDVSYCKRSKLDVSSLGSATTGKSFIAGLPEPGEVTLDLNCTAAEAAILATDLYDGSTDTYTLAIPPMPTGGATMVWTSGAFVTDVSISNTEDKVLGMKAVLKPTVFGTFTPGDNYTWLDTLIDVAVAGTSDDYTITWSDGTLPFNGFITDLSLTVGEDKEITAKVTFALTAWATYAS